MPITNYYWDVDTDNVILEEDENRNTIAEYTQEPSLYGELIAQERDGHASFYNFDGQGSTRELTDENQSVTDTYTYDAFGVEVARTGTMWNPFGFVGSLGYYKSSPNQDMYVRSRSYASAFGRWRSVDLLFEVQPANNPYDYAQNSPLNAIDPSGLMIREVEWYPKANPCGGYTVGINYRAEVQPAAAPPPKTVFYIQRICFLSNSEITWCDWGAEGGCACGKKWPPKKCAPCCVLEFVGVGTYLGNGQYSPSGYDQHGIPSLGTHDCLATGYLGITALMRAIVPNRAVTDWLTKNKNNTQWLCNTGCIGKRVILTNPGTSGLKTDADLPDWFNTNSVDQIAVDTGAAFDCCQGPNSQVTFFPGGIHVWPPGYFQFGNF